VKTVVVSAEEVVQKIVDSRALNDDELELIFQIAGVRVSLSPIVDQEYQMDKGKYFAMVPVRRGNRGRGKMVLSPSTLKKFKSISEEEYPLAVHELLNLHAGKRDQFRVSMKKVVRFLAYFFDAKRLERFLDLVWIERVGVEIHIASKRSKEGYMKFPIRDNEDFKLQEIEALVKLFCASMDTRLENGDIVFRKRTTGERLSYDPDVMMVFAAASCGISIVRNNIPTLVTVK